MPAPDLGAFVRKNDVDLVAISASNPALVGELAASVQAIRAASGDRAIPIAVGGRVATVPNLATTIEADGVVHSVAEAVAFARRHRPAD
jgi:hypothetical protein